MKKLIVLISLMLCFCSAEIKVNDNQTPEVKPVVNANDTGGQVVVVPEVVVPKVAPVEDNTVKYLLLSGLGVCGLMFIIIAISKINREE